MCNNSSTKINMKRSWKCFLYACSFLFSLPFHPILLIISYATKDPEKEVCLLYESMWFFPISLYGACCKDVVFVEAVLTKRSCTAGFVLLDATPCHLIYKAQKQKSAHSNKKFFLLLSQKTLHSNAWTNHNFSLVC